MIQTIVRPAPHPFSAAEIARRADEAIFAQGVQAGHEDAIAHLVDLIRDAWGDMHYARGQRRRFGHEDPGQQLWCAIADRHQAYLLSALAIRRALKEGAHP